MIVVGFIIIAAAAAGVIYARSAGTTTSEVTNADKTIKETTTKNAPSDTFLLSVVATGAALVIIGALYSRITTITLPGGTVLGLNQSEKEKITKEVGKTAEQKGLDSEKTAAATTKALDRARAKKTMIGTLELDDQALTEVVAETFN